MIGLAEQILVVEKLWKMTNEICGMLIFVPATQTIIGVFIDDNKKDSFNMMLRQYCREKNIKEFCTITEAWMIMGKKDIPLKVMPRDDPNRKEILLICLVSKQGNQSAFAEISTKDGKRILGGWMYNAEAEIKTRYDSCLQYD